MNTHEQAVSLLISRARAAQEEFDKYSQSEVDEAVIAAAWALLNPKHNRQLSRLALRMTGLGRVEDKVRKNERKTLGLLRDLKKVKTIGIINECKSRGIVEIARPVGVVAALTPSTNPLATPLNNILNALKCRNSIIIAPSPSGEAVLEELLKHVNHELKRVKAPENLVQQLPAPVNKATSGELMKQSDLVVVTGSQNNVRAAYSSGTPAIGVGMGNVSVIVDETADTRDAAEKISRSKTFDHATSCSSENNLILVDEIYEEMMNGMFRQNGVMLVAEEKERLQHILWRDGKLNRDILAKSPAVICHKAGLHRHGLSGCAFLMVEETGIGSEFPFSGEKLSPVLAVFRAADFDDATGLALRLLNYQGKGHSIGLHSKKKERALKLGLELPVCRVILNQAHCFATGGGFDNGLPFSLSMGCGTWGGNSISENLNYRHFLNITMVSSSISKDEISMDEVFFDYKNKHGL